MSKNILHIEIQPVRAALDRFGHALQNLEEGKTIEPYYGIGFETPPQFARVFTEKRWELIAALKDAGPLTIYALAKQLHRHYRNVYKDIQALMEWSVVEKDGDGHVSIPWDAIDVRLPLKRALPGMVHPPSGEARQHMGGWRSEALLWVDWEVLVLITGASSGIGAATARAFVKAGSSVMPAAEIVYSPSRRNWDLSCCLCSWMCGRPLPFQNCPNPFRRIFPKWMSWSITRDWRWGLSRPTVRRWTIGKP